MKAPVNLAAWLAFSAAAGTFLAVWVLGVRRHYRVRAAPPLLLKARCSDGWELGVFYRAAAHRRFREPVLLCHGLAANHFNFDFEPPFSVAHALSERGFDCFSIDLRGARASRPPAWRWPKNYSVDDHIRFDAPTLLDLALKRSGAAQAFWVGHSLGGLIGLAVAEGGRAGQLRGLATLGAPAYFNYDPPLKRSVRFGLALAWPYRLRYELLSGALAPFLGGVVLPFSDVIAYPRHITEQVQRKLYAQLITSVSRGVLAQFWDWVEHNAFRSLDRQVDYREGIKSLGPPMLVIGASRDQLAPPWSVQWAFELAGSSDKTLKIFGREYGESQDYGHGDLIFGERAPYDVFPLIADWLAARATPLQPTGPSTDDSVESAEGHGATSAPLLDRALENQGTTSAQELDRALIGSPRARETRAIAPLGHSNQRGP
jgi:pimeloyl-ACP methyl ester carboxylesterase